MFLIKRSRVKKNELLGIGLGIPGPVSNRRGDIPFSPHLKGWKGVPVRKMIENVNKSPNKLIY